MVRKIQVLFSNKNKYQCITKIFICMTFPLPQGRDLGIFRPSVTKISGHGKHSSPRFTAGDRVIFSPICTCEGCKLIEQWYLKRGAEFTVKTIVEKNEWITIELEEVPEKFFASMMFIKK